MKKNIKLLSSLIGLTTLSSLIPLSATANSSSVILNQDVVNKKTNEGEITANASDVFTQLTDEPTGTISCTQGSGSKIIGYSEDFSVKNAKLLESSHIVGAFWGGVADSGFKNCTSIYGSLDLSIITSDIEFGESAFDGCSNLTELKLTDNPYNWNTTPDKGKPYMFFSIGANAFNGCTSLTTLNFPMIQGSFDKGYVNFDENWLGDIDGSKLTIHVPKGMINTYKTKVPGIESATFIDDMENPEYSNLNLPLVLGLSLGIGIPVLGAIIGGTIYGVKKHKAKK